MKPGTGKIMTEYPEVGKLYRVYPWNAVNAPPGISGFGKIDTKALRGNAQVDLDTAGQRGAPYVNSAIGGADRLSIGNGPGPVHHFSGGGEG